MSGQKGDKTMAKKKSHLECRIRYDENWRGQGEYFVFENKWTNEGDDAWGLDTAFKLRPNGNKEGELVHYTALTKIRELQRLGIPFYFY